MEAIEMKWIEDQLEKAMVSRKCGDMVVELMNVFNEKSSSLDKETFEKAVSIFGKMCLGHSIVEKTEDFKGTWIDCQAGQIRVSEIVRVKDDAFLGSEGTIHNGRICRVVGVRYGDIVCNSTDNKLPKISGAHYRPTQLRKLV